MSRSALIRLAHSGMHPNRLGQLLEHHGTTARTLQAVVAGRVELPDRARRAAVVPAAQRLAEADAGGYRLVVRGDPDYPTQLAGVAYAPPVLFLRGSVPAAAAVAVVGTRRCTRYGRALAHSFGGAIAAAGWTMVSGLAYGVDGAAHLGAERGPAPQVAVLGSGIDRWYPADHAGLGDRIAASGAVISEYPPGTPPVGWRFPPRNRIIAGLAAVTVVVEAARTGGALITARYAVEQGREVFAVPGDIDRATSGGTNELIRDGAWPVFDAQDLIESLERVLGAPPHCAPRADEALIEALGPTGMPIAELCAVLDRRAEDVMAEVARLEAERIVDFDGSVVTVRSSR